MIREIRYAIRQLAKHPGFTLVSALTLGLGLAQTPPSSASSTRFFCGRYLIRIPSSSFFCANDPRPSTPAQSSYPNYLDWRALSAGLPIWRYFGAIAPTFLPKSAKPIRTNRRRARDLELFGILVCRQKLGRDFAEADDLPAAESGPHHNTLWQRRFGGSRDVLGQPITIDGTSREIIGVVPEKVGLPRLAEVYLPMDELRAEDGVSSPRQSPWFLGPRPVESRNYARTSGGRYEQYRARSGATLSRRGRWPDGEHAHFARGQRGGLSAKCVAALRRRCVRFAIACANVCQSSTFPGIEPQDHASWRSEQRFGASRSQLVRQLSSKASCLF